MTGQQQTINPPPHNDQETVVSDSLSSNHLGIVVKDALPNIEQAPQQISIAKVPQVFIREYCATGSEFLHILG